MDSLQVNRTGKALFEPLSTLQLYKARKGVYDEVGAFLILVSYDPRFLMLSSWQSSLWPQICTSGHSALSRAVTDSQRRLVALSLLVELGVTLFILDCGHVTSTEPIHRFIEEVMNPLKRA